MAAPQKVKKLPKNPKEGEKYILTVKGRGKGKRAITFQATGKSGFGKWRIIANNPA